ncbi:2-phospho-L-lactate guanylyltransferase [Longispora fulva]|uniref:Phosphoenolpyruvate guanylyltransferase n=1 Tax=Longispora fulva TaxID=619741 RepID=A0A8J7KMZ2_9ACTN|nr:2-phospho-L-lactate guanylyltransferase [Longispora fulva]MBG6141049.1 2-phospho-L-lactate guanylyltransferase [Longispora fulva]GIG60681.1 2-phospho-L-lactate guanylyltransferase [Longispora fulva]
MSPWSLIIPVKRAVLGKSRLRGATPGAQHERLARALALDTVAAAFACPAVRRVLVVTDDEELRAALPAGVLVTADPATAAGRDGLNAAIRHGQAVLRAHETGRIVALTADLPALRPADLTAALAAARWHHRCHVPDAAGTGTTLLASAGDLRPAFGPGSAAAHARSGAVALAGEWPSLRLDVDTPADLVAAVALGLGRHTSDAIGRRRAEQVSP